MLGNFRASRRAYEVQPAPKDQRAIVEHLGHRLDVAFDCQVPQFARLLGRDAEQMTQIVTVARMVRLALDVLKEGPEPRAFGVLGIAHSMLGNFRASRRAYEQAVELEPDHAGYRHNLGHLLDVAFERPREALRHLAVAPSPRPAGAGHRDFGSARPRPLRPGGQSLRVARSSTRLDACGRRRARRRVGRGPRSVALARQRTRHACASDPFAEQRVGTIDRG